MRDSPDLSQAVLAGIPAASFFCMYMYESGRYSFVGVPPEFVEIPLNRMPILLSSMIFLICLWLITALLSFHLQNSENKYRKWFGNFLFILILFGPIPFLVNPSLIGLGLAIFVAIGFAMDPRNISGSPENKAATDTSKYSDEQKRMQSIGLFLFMIFFFSAMLFAAGKAIQSKQASYMTLDGLPNHVIVGTYAGSFIAKQFNPTTLRLRTGVILVPIDSGRTQIVRQTSVRLSK
jgi:hypothetical protein